MHQDLYLLSSMLRQNSDLSRGTKAKRIKNFILTLSKDLEEGKRVFIIDIEDTTNQNLYSMTIDQTDLRMNRQLQCINDAPHQLYNFFIGHQNRIDLGKENEPHSISLSLKIPKSESNLIGIKINLLIKRAIHKQELIKMRKNLQMATQDHRAKERILEDQKRAQETELQKKNQQIKRLKAQIQHLKRSNRPSVSKMQKEDSEIQGQDDEYSQAVHRYSHPQNPFENSYKIELDGSKITISKKRTETSFEHFIFTDSLKRGNIYIFSIKQIRAPISSGDMISGIGTKNSFALLNVHMEPQTIMCFHEDSVIYENGEIMSRQAGIWRPNYKLKVDLVNLVIYWAYENQRAITMPISEDLAKTDLYLFVGLRNADHEVSIVQVE